MTSPVLMPNLAPKALALDFGVLGRRAIHVLPGRLIATIDELSNRARFRRPRPRRRRRDPRGYENSRRATAPEITLETPTKRTTRSGGC